MSKKAVNKERFVPNEGTEEENQAAAIKAATQLLEKIKKMLAKLGDQNEEGEEGDQGLSAETLALLQEILGGDNEPADDEPDGGPDDAGDDGEDKDKDNPPTPPRPEPLVADIVAEPPGPEDMQNVPELPRNPTVNEDGKQLTQEEWNGMNNKQKFDALQATNAANENRRNLGLGPMKPMPPETNPLEQRNHANGQLDQIIGGPNDPLRVDQDKPVNKEGKDLTPAEVGKVLNDMGIKLPIVDEVARNKIKELQRQNKMLEKKNQQTRNNPPPIRQQQPDAGVARNMQKAIKNAQQWGGGGVALPEGVSDAKMVTWKRAAEFGNQKWKELVGQGVVKEKQNFNPKMGSKGLDRKHLAQAAETHTTLEIGPQNKSTPDTNTSKDGIFADDIARLQNIIDPLGGVGPDGFGGQDLTKPQKVRGATVIENVKNPHSNEQVPRRVWKESKDLDPRANPRGGVMLGNKNLSVAKVANQNANKKMGNCMIMPPLAYAHESYDDIPRMIMDLRKNGRKTSANANLVGRIQQDFKDAGKVPPTLDQIGNLLGDNGNWSPGWGIDNTCISPDTFNVRKNDYNFSNNNSAKKSAFVNNNNSENLQADGSDMTFDVSTINQDGVTRKYEIPQEQIRYDTKLANSYPRQHNPKRGVQICGGLPLNNKTVNPSLKNADRKNIQSTALRNQHIAICSWD